MAIPFNKPHFAGNELKYIKDALERKHISGDGYYTNKCHAWLEEVTGCKKALLTHSCTAALEMTAILADIQPGDEVIMPSYTFVSTANAFVLRGGVPVFIDIHADTMNMDETLIEAAITAKTKAIIPVHYAGVGCEMDAIMAIADKYKLLVIEDAAQGLMATYKGKALGSIGHLGTLSFHETKNITSGEGGALLINDEKFIERAEIIREKGTNRSKFFRGQLDKYTWVDIGSSFLPGDKTAAFLYAQIEHAKRITDVRMAIWHKYFELLQPLAQAGLVELAFIPKHCTHNAHMFYIKVKILSERSALIRYLKDNHISSVFHYVPLHTSEAGQKFSRFCGEDIYTTKESERLLRLPLYVDLELVSVGYVVSKIMNFLRR